MVDPARGPSEAESEERSGSAPAAGAELPEPGAPPTPRLRLPGQRGELSARIVYHLVLPWVPLLLALGAIEGWALLMRDPMSLLGWVRGLVEPISRPLLGGVLLGWWVAATAVRVMIEQRVLSARRRIVEEASADTTPRVRAGDLWALQLVRLTGQVGVGAVVWIAAQSWHLVLEAPLGERALPLVWFSSWIAWLALLVWWELTLVLVSLLLSLGERRWFRGLRRVVASQRQQVRALWRLWWAWLARTTLLLALAGLFGARLLRDAEPSSGALWGMTVAVLLVVGALSVQMRVLVDRALFVLALRQLPGAGGPAAEIGEGLFARDSAPEGAPEPGGTLSFDGRLASREHTELVEGETIADRPWPNALPGLYNSAPGEPVSLEGIGAVLAVRDRPRPTAPSTPKPASEALDARGGGVAGGEWPADVIPAFVPAPRPADGGEAAVGQGLPSPLVSPPEEAGAVEAADVPSEGTLRWAREVILDGIRQEADVARDEVLCEEVSADAASKVCVMRSSSGTPELHLME